MQIRELAVPDAYEISTVQHRDDRGVFFEWYRFDVLEKAVGHALELRQANTSISKRGTIRGIHFADVPPSQAKCVTCTRGTVIDFVVDIRMGSPAFGTWDSVQLDDVDHRATYIGEGLGHCFVALSEIATVSYLVSDVYRPEREHGITPLDPDVALQFPLESRQLVVSPKDLAAPTLATALELGLLPSYRAAKDYYASMGSPKGTV